MLLVLETLPPTERAVFVLREVFDLPYAEIAAAVDKSEAAVRQVAHRARSHVGATPALDGQRGRARRGRSTASAPPPRPATCRGWWTCSPRTWS